MERLIITDKIQDIAINYCNDVINRFGDIIEKNLMGLRHKILDSDDPNKKDYVFYIDLLKYNIKSVILVTPQFFEDPLVGVLNFNDIIDFSKIFEYTNAGTKYKTVKFANEIINALCYERIRNEIIPTYVKQLEIRTCIYCNANWAITFGGRRNHKKRGYYEIDHFKPKNLYPHLCISFFNLQPSCGGCNRTKSTDEALFNLYVENGENVELNPFVFELEKNLFINYYINKNDNHIEVLFKGKSGYEKLAENHNNIFHIEELYQEFGPEVEELIWRFKTYNKRYIDILVKSFVKLFLNKQSDISRFLYGFYQSEEDIHKRPLTKLHQDIFTQLTKMQA